MRLKIELEINDNTPDTYPDLYIDWSTWNSETSTVKVKYHSLEQSSQNEKSRNNAISHSSGSERVS